MGSAVRSVLFRSVLIAGLLQAMGVDAGAVMVYKSNQGVVTNNGHAVALVKLPGKQDLIVDASDREPFPRQEGLFVKARDYRYVNPVYGKRSHKIRWYTPASGNQRIGTTQLGTLDYSFLRSQFWYYRGERAKGGLLSSHRTSKGLEAAARALRTSVKLCPRNPLSVYMLGRVYLTQGNLRQARKLLGTAYQLYSQFGWVPEDPKQYLASANQRSTSGARL